MTVGIIVYVCGCLVTLMFNYGASVVSERWDNSNEQATNECQ